MKCPKPILLLLCAASLLCSCGGGGDSGDRMTDYWVSATRFANQTKFIKLTNATGSVVIKSRESINIGPDDGGDLDGDATDTGEIVGELTTYDMANTAVFLASGTRYTTDPEHKTATLRILTLEQPSSGTASREATSMLVQLLGAPGRYVDPSGTKHYYQIDSTVTFELDYNTGRWEVRGSTSRPDQLGGQGTFSVIPAY